VFPKEGESSLSPTSVESVHDLDATVALCVTLADACGLHTHDRRRAWGPQDSTSRSVLKLSILGLVLTNLDGNLM
jgi:hypothetical protein